MQVRAQNPKEGPSYQASPESPTSMYLSLDLPVRPGSSYHYSGYLWRSLFIVDGMQSPKAAALVAGKLTPTSPNSSVKYEFHENGRRMSAAIVSGSLPLWTESFCELSDDANQLGACQPAAITSLTTQKIYNRNHFLFFRFSQSRWFYYSTSSPFSSMANFKPPFTNYRIAHRAF